MSQSHPDVGIWVKKGDLASIKASIKQGWGFSSPEDCYLLPYAVECGFLDIVKYLVKQGFDVQSGDLLVKCIRGENVALAKYLIEEAGCDPRRSLSFREQWIESHRDPERSLSSRGIESPRDPERSLSFPSEGIESPRDPESIPAAGIESPRDPKGLAVNYRFALQIAIKENSLVMANYFIDQGCDVTVNNYYIFWLSLTLPDRKIFKLIFSLISNRDQNKFLAARDLKEVTYFDFCFRLQHFETHTNAKLRPSATGFEKTIVDLNYVQEGMRPQAKQNGIREKFVLNYVKQKNRLLKSILKPTSLFIQFVYF
jgi:hypothetical protein